jgi:hypothetical protein
VTVTSLNTLLVFLLGFGVLGATRGPKHEIWTLGGITLTMLFLSLGGVDIVKQLPVRIASGFLAVSGNQDGSNNAAAHPLSEPWTIIMLWLGTIALVVIAYAMGQKFGKEEKTRDFGSYMGGFLMGAINGACICLFLFSQGGFQNVNIQFPDGQMARTTIAPLIIIGLFVVGVAFVATRPKPASSSGGGK